MIWLHPYPYARDIIVKKSIELFNMVKKVAFLGLDGLDYELLNLALDRGLMPFLKSILYKSVRARIWCYPPYTPPMWTSIKTSVNPGKHGIIDFYLFNENRVLTSLDIEYPCIWFILAQHRLRSIVLANDDPRLYGNYVDLMSDSLASIKVRTNSIWLKLLKMGYIPYNKLFPYLWRRLDDYCEQITKNIYLLRDFIDDVKSKNELSLLWLELREPDYFLHSKPRLVYNLANNISKWFSAIDKLIEKLYELFDLVLIASDHGFRLQRGVNLSRKLYEHNLLRINLKNMNDELLHHVLKVSSVLDKISIPILWKALSRFFKPSIDRASPCYVNLGMISSNYIVLNKRYSKAFQTISALLQKIIAKIPGIKDLIPFNDFFWGPYSNREPGYIVMLRKGYALSDFFSNPISNIYTHFPEGVLIVLDNDVEPNELNLIYPWDIVPTILAYMGLPIPKDTDGRVLSSIAQDHGIRKDYLGRYRVFLHIVRTRAKSSYVV